MSLDKHFFVEQLCRRFQESIAVALRAEEDARDAARHMATEAEKKEDARVALEFGGLAAGHAARSRKATAELDELLLFGKRPLPSYSHQSAIGLGALVDLSTDTDDGPEERSYLLLPVGAGTELTGPGGDGFLSVITPASPIGRGLMGKRVGDFVDVRVRDDWREWQIVDVA